MDDPVFKQKYQKYKLRVKVWEKDFKRKYHRIPSKYDIRDAPQEIRDSYKMYYKLKTSLLEDTLNDVLSEDGFDILETSQADLEDSFSGPQLPLDISTISNVDLIGQITVFSNLSDLKSPTQLTNTVNVNDNHVIKEFEPVQESEHNSKAWGSSVSKKPLPKSTELTVRQSFKSNLNAKLFKTASFSKRNPRKSLVRSNKDLSQSSAISSQSELVDPSDILPDLETILTQRAKELATKEPSSDMMASIGLTKPVKAFTAKLDLGWLNRNATNEGDALLIKSQVKLSVPMGMTNINISKIIAAAKETELETQQAVTDIPTSFNFNNDSDSVVSNSEDENITKEYRHIAKRRRVLTTIDKNQQQIKVTEKELAKTPVSVEEPSKSPEYSPVLAKKKRNRTKKTDLCDEEDYKVKSVRKRIIAKKTKPAAKKNVKKELSTTSTTRKSTRASKVQKQEKPPQPEEHDEGEGTVPDPEDIKYTLALETSNLACLPRFNVDDLKTANSIAEEYIKKIAFPKATSKTRQQTSVNEKRKADLTKLQAKVASGKLNENFVQINMKKKVFVRGHKHVNFSQYKKKLWKQKKVSALTGPDMNMGGCDGGVLTCFTCGQPGHFAQQCKLKGDNLLPMSVEIEEDSAFPTLEEAERMAIQNAVAVHSSNLDKLPEANNSRLLREEPATEEDSETGGEFHKIGLEEEALIPDRDSSSPQKTYIGHKIPEDFLKKAGLLDTPKISSESGALYDLNPDGSVKGTTEEVYEALRMFGHSDFRKGQDRAIMRILSGQSTLVTLSTGSGKSLCYQLPAYLYSKQKHSITLVISPLVSLMEDQVHGVPHFLRAHCLHTNQTPQSRLKIIEMINTGQIDILLVSPEAVCAGERSTGFGSILRKLPPIAFACIDEAHCVSQWSHNFRPSYLMICKVLRQNLGVKTVLGLTATATLPTRHSIIKHLGIPDGERGIISDIPLPDNLIISVSKDENKNEALIGLLSSKRFDLCQSIIIYCTRRDECERIASHIRTYMQDRKSDGASQNGKKKRKRVNWEAEPYHAGLPASRRRTIQNSFMKNELRIVVATIAFGMGINKSDIRSVIHYNMPRNFESYVQEIGRAGRDGLIAHCHLFLDSKGDDKSELRRHIFANSIDRHVIRKLLQKIFIPCSCDKNLRKNDFVKEHLDEIKASQDIDWDDDIFDDTKANVVQSEHTKKPMKKRFCPGHEIGFSIESTVMALDIPEQNISTLLCYLELDYRWGIHALSSAYIKCKVISYGGPKYIKQAAKGCPPLAMAIALQLKNKTFKEDTNTIEFSVIDIAAAIGWNSGVVKYQLKNLEWTTENGYPKRTPLIIQFCDLGFRIKAPGDFTLDEIDEALDALYNRSVTQEKTQLIQLQYVFNGLSSVAYTSYQPCTAEDYPHDRSEKLKSIIRDYFQNDYPNDMVLEKEDSSVPDEAIVCDIHAIINMYPDNTFSGRNIARIFHGIQSPNYPAVIWGRCKYWRALSKVCFNRIVQLANAVIVKMRT